MKIPNLPDQKTPLIDPNDPKKTMINPVWHMFFGQLIQEMQNNLSEEGIGIPAQSSANINTIQSANPTSTLIANKDTGDVYVSINGIFKKITVT